MGTVELRPTRAGKWVIEKKTTAGLQMICLTDEDLAVVVAEGAMRLQEKRR